MEDFEPGLGERFALLLRQGAGNLVSALAHQLGRLLEDLGAVVDRKSTPGRERPLGGGDGAVGFGAGAISNLGQDRLVGRIDHGQRLAVLCLAPRSVDVHPCRILCRSRLVSARRRCHVWLSAFDGLAVPMRHSPGHDRELELEQDTRPEPLSSLQTGSPLPRYCPNSSRSTDLVAEQESSSVRSKKLKATSKLEEYAVWVDLGSCSGH